MGPKIFLYHSIYAIRYTSNPQIILFFFPFWLLSLPPGMERYAIVYKTTKRNCLLNLPTYRSIVFVKLLKRSCVRNHSYRIIRSQARLSTLILIPDLNVLSFIYVFTCVRKRYTRKHVWLKKTNNTKKKKKDFLVISRLHDLYYLRPKTLEAHTEVRCHLSLSS